MTRAHSAADRASRPAPGTTRRGFLETAGGLAVSTVAALAAGCANQGAPGGGSGPLAGKRIGISSPHKVEILNALYAQMREVAANEAPEVEIIVVDAENDAVKQLTDIEAFIAQGYDAIFFLALPSAGLDALVARGAEAGIVMVSHGASPVTGVTQNIVLDQHESGRQLGLFAGQWINERHGGHGEVGLLGNAADPYLQLRTQGIKDGLAEGAPGAKLAGEVHGHSIELGAAGAANLLQAHPKLCALLAHADDPGLGCYTAATEAGKTDPDEFLVASCDGTALVLDKIAESGIYQATWSYLFPYSAVAAMRDLLAGLRGEAVAPTRTQLGTLVTRSNLRQVQAMCAAPQAPENRAVFADPSVMQYSDEPLKSPPA